MNAPQYMLAVLGMFSCLVVGLYHFEERTTCRLTGRSKRGYKRNSVSCCHKAVRLANSSTSGCPPRSLKRSGPCCNAATLFQARGLIPAQGPLAKTHTLPKPRPYLMIWGFQKLGVRFGVPKKKRINMYYRHNKNSHSFS